MIIYSTIDKNNIINVHHIRYWLYDNCKKWIIYDTLPTIYIIFTTNSSSRIDNIIKDFKSNISKQLKNCVFFLKSQSKFFKSKKLNNNNKNDLTKTLKQYFFIGQEAQYDFNNIELKGYTKNYIIKLLNNQEIEKIDSKKNSPVTIVESNPLTTESKIDCDIEKKTCTKCLKIFSTVSNCNRHVKNCC